MKTVPQSIFRGWAYRYTVALEAIALLVFIILQVLNIYTHTVSLDWLTRVNAFFLIYLALIAWRRFDGGVHITFFFLGTLLLFQAGRLLAFTFGPLFGADSRGLDPFPITLMRAGMPIDVSDKTAEITMLAIILSAVCIYLPCSFRYVRLKMPHPPSPRFMRALYRLYFITLPFLVYKNVRYLLFIKAHGGYLALYTQGPQVVSSVGVVSRVVSSFAALSFLALYVFEDKSRRLYFLTSTYFLASGIDLLIGLRGKIFTLLLALWLIHAIKRRKHFKIFRIVAVAVTLMLLAIAVDSYRGNDSLAAITLPSDPIFYFIAGQGVSMQVTEAVIGYGPEFVHNPFTYLRHEVTSTIIPEAAQVQRPNGLFLADDLSYFLNPQTARMGYGTGSSYLAETYLFGGIVGVVGISSLLGYLFAWLHSVSNSPIGLMILAYTMPYLIYLPRDTLLNPLAEVLKMVVAIILAVPIFYVAFKVPRIRFRICRRMEQLEI